MRTRLFVSLVCLLAVAAPAFAQSGHGGSNFKPLAAEDAPRRTPRKKIDRFTSIGDVVAKGKKVRRNQGGKVEDACEFVAGGSFSTEILDGERIINTTRRADCTVVIESIEDRDVVEPDASQAFVRPRPAAARPPGLLARLFDVVTMTTPVSAQSLSPYYRLKEAYANVYTGSYGSGMTALEQTMTLAYDYLYASRWDWHGWFCTAGMTYPGQSWCEPGGPMGVAGQPMAPINPGWLGVKGGTASTGTRVAGYESWSYLEEDYMLATGNAINNYSKHKLWIRITGSNWGVIRCEFDNVGLYPQGGKNSTYPTTTANRCLVR